MHSGAVRPVRVPFRPRRKASLRLHFTDLGTTTAVTIARLWLWWAAAVFDGGLPRALRALGALVGAVKALIGRNYAQHPQNRGSHNNPT